MSRGGRRSERDRQTEREDLGAGGEGRTRGLADLVTVYKRARSM